MRKKKVHQTKLRKKKEIINRGNKWLTNMKSSSLRIFKKLNKTSWIDWEEGNNFKLYG